MSTGTNDANRCQWCGLFHQSKCPLVKAIEYRDDGRIKCVEFFAPNDYPQAQTAIPGPFGNPNISRS